MLRDSHGDVVIIPQEDNVRAVLQWIGVNKEQSSTGTTDTTFPTMDGSTSKSTK
jgi:hypothetical protein